MESSVRHHLHAAAYHGLAAISISSVLLLMAVPALQLAHALQEHGYKGWPASDRRVAGYAGYGGTAFAELLCWLGVVLAVRGMVVAGRTTESRALCVAGLALSLFAAGLWVMCGFAWHAQSAWLIK